MKRIMMICLVCLLVSATSYAVANRVGENSFTTGTGTMTLSGAKTGYVAFADVYTSPATVTYLIESSTGLEWEIGSGTWTDGTPHDTLARDTVEASSNSGSKVDFSAGTKSVFNIVSAAEYDAFLASAPSYTFGTGLSETDNHVICTVTGGTVDRIISVKLTSDTGDALTTGDGKMIWTVPAPLNGYVIDAVSASVTTVSSSGVPEFDLYNITDSTDILSTDLTIDESEYHSSTAATAAVIDTANDDLATADQIRIDCNVAGTGTKGVQIDIICVSGE